MTREEEYLRRKVALLAGTGSILDIGGGLRVLKGKGNRFDANRAAWALPLLQGVEYRIADRVATYSPDVVADLRNMPFDDGTLPSIVCLSVLEHVEDPFRAVSEMHRVLKIGGLCLAHLPFIFPYHAEPGYYGDFWRFTHEGCAVLFKAFSKVEVTHVHELLETIAYLSPLKRIPGFLRLSRHVDGLLGRPQRGRTAGFLVFASK
jgi:SAM-dependent methyltransferase